MIFRESPGPCKAASVGGLAYRHIGYFIPLLIGHRERKALIARFFCKLAGNLSGMSPRGFEVWVVLPLLILKRAAATSPSSRRVNASAFTRPRFRWDRKSHGQRRRPHRRDVQGVFPEVGLDRHGEKRRDQTGIGADGLGWIHTIRQHCGNLWRSCRPRRRKLEEGGSTCGCVPSEGRCEGSTHTISVATFWTKMLSASDCVTRGVVHAVRPALKLCYFPNAAGGGGRS